MQVSGRPSTGLDSFDAVIDGLRPGDNVVWQVGTIEEYAYFVGFFVRRALDERHKTIYLRFAQHPPLVKPDPGITRYELNAKDGFESFSTQAHAIMTREGQGAYYIFDCLSDLLSAWATDLMIGNFFMIACPYLFQLNTLAYFGLVRGSHAFKTVARIRETTQILLNVSTSGADLYVHPLKVKGRYAPTMFLPHKQEGGRFVPVTSSVDITRLGETLSGGETDRVKRTLDTWDRLFFSAEELLHQAGRDEEKRVLLDHLCSIMIGREERIRALARESFTLQDLLGIKERLIGTGYIGGKAAGMLIARKILLRDAAGDWARYLEPHDSFFIGSDVFYTYIVENGWWKLLMSQKTKEGFFDVARILRELMLEGSFPDEIEEQFWRLIEYFGQAPIIIRSSSLLEDAFGNAFAGKYESIFCVNQGSPEQRYKQFRDCVRQVFASTMNEDALTYRRQRGLDQQDEQMALLVQRVSGSYRGRYFFPDLAGVGISYNTFAWNQDMDPKAGMLRLVLGLGTRAVNRVEHDYPRIVALDAPLLKPHAGLGDTRKYSQHHMDVLNIEHNKLETIPLTQVFDEDMRIDIDLLFTKDIETGSAGRERGIRDRESWVLTLDPLLLQSPCPRIMQTMLKKLESSYGYPVDIEFTANFRKDGSFHINLVQCRPLQTKGEKAQVRIPTDINPEAILFQTRGGFMGNNIIQPISRIISIDPEAYSRLPLAERHSIARLIGKLNRQIQRRQARPVLLMGPGRWGTTTPSLGVPVRFAEINNIAVMVEIEHAGGSLMPELSFGTHFFQDLVETDISYVALFLGKEGSFFNKKWLAAMQNDLAAVLPDSSRYAGVVHVCNTADKNLCFMADVVSQSIVCFSSPNADP